jgi:hypothetical protein
MLLVKGRVLRSMVQLNAPPRVVAKRLAREDACGRSRVQFPGPPNLVWLFFRGFSTPSYRVMKDVAFSIDIDNTLHSTNVKFAHRGLVFYCLLDF